MNFASRLKESVDDLLGNYLATDGLGPDAYYDVPCTHPMAEGKYLLTLGEFYRSKLIDINDFQKQVTKACERLDAKKIRIAGGIGWGLGFSWRDLPPKEPYLITTAIILHGLGTIAQLHTPGERFASLINGAIGGLSSWVVEQTAPYSDLPVELPIFSPGIREPVLNSAAYALYVLKQYSNDDAVRRQAEQTLNSIAALRTDGIGWEYSPSNRIVDLLHQCYLLNVLSESDPAQLERQLVELVRLFDSVGGYADKCEVLGNEPPQLSVDVLLVRHIGGLYADVARKPARLWSLGELLVTMSKVAAISSNQLAWKRRAHAVAEAILYHLKQHTAETRYPRHAMHAAHGLASYLAFLRQQQQREPTAKPIELEPCSTTTAL